MILAFAAGGAFGQTAGLPSPTPPGVADRPRPEYEAQGLRAGDFRLFPSLTAAAGFDSNPLTTGTNASPDGFARLTPMVVGRSLWSRHALQFEAAVDGIRYFEHTQLGGLNARAGALGTLQLNGTDTLTLNASYVRMTDAGVLAAGAIPGILPANFINNDRSVLNQYTAGLRWFARLGPLESTTSFGAVHYGYEATPETGVTAAQQQARDNDAFVFTQRLGAPLAPTLTGFVEASYNLRRYTQGGFDSEGYRLNLGVSSSLTRLLAGEVFVGVLSQNFSGTTGTSTVPNFGGRLRWFATERVTASIFFGRDVSQPPVSGGPPGIYTAVGPALDIELRRDLLLNLAAQGYGISYPQGGGTDRFVQAEAGLRWLLSNRLQLGAVYRYQQRAGSAGGAQPFIRNQFVLSLRSAL